MRLEYKYLVPLECVAELRSNLLPFFNEDKFVCQRSPKEYTVRSIYFDTVNLDYYYEKIEGIKSRRKIRIRGYNRSEEDSPVFLEIKKKLENHIWKNRFALCYHDLTDELSKGCVPNFASSQNGNTSPSEDGQRFFYNIFRKDLRPIVLVTYEREAYHCKFKQEIRITFDKNLRAHAFPGLGDLFEETELYPIMNKHVLLEIKFREGFPEWLQAEIKRFRLQQRAFSKYTVCLESQKRLRSINPKTILANTNPLLESANV